MISSNCTTVKNNKAIITKLFWRKINFNAYCNRKLMTVGWKKNKELLRMKLIATCNLFVSAVC